MIEVRCYVCSSIFCIEPKYREVEILVLERKKHHVAAEYTKEKIKRGIHCPYCGSFLLDKVLKEK